MIAAGGQWTAERRNGIAAEGSQPLRCQTWRAGVRAACCRPSAIRASPGVSFRKATVHRAPRQLVLGSCQSGKTPADPWFLQARGL